MSDETPRDNRTTDTGTTDGDRTTDTGTTDGDRTTDAGTTDGDGTTDPGTTDLGTTDLGTTDAGTTDAGTTDAGTTDLGTTDEIAPTEGLTAEEAERAHLRGPEGKPDKGFRRMQELRKVSRDYPFICPVDFKPHTGSPPGQDPNDDPTFIPNHLEDDGGHYLG